MVFHDKPGCDGNGDCRGDHCCYIRSKPCIFLEYNALPNRKYTCKLRRELGSWEAVHADPRYLNNVQVYWDQVGIKSCGDWPTDNYLNRRNAKRGSSSFCCFGRKRSEFK